MSGWATGVWYEQRSRVPRFDWPTLFGHLPQDAGAPWVQWLARHHHADTLFEVVALGQAQPEAADLRSEPLRRRCTVLVLAGRWEEALSGLRASPPVKAELVLLLVPPGTDPPGHDLLEAVRSAGRAAAAAAVGTDHSGQTLIDLIESLAHDQDLAGALLGHDAHVVGPRAALETVRVRRFGEGLLGRARQLPDAPYHLPDEQQQKLLRRLRSAGGATGFAEALERIVGSGPFHAESGEASTVALAARALSAAEASGRRAGRVAGGARSPLVDMHTRGPAPGGLESLEGLESLVGTRGPGPGPELERHLQVQVTDERGTRVNGLPHDAPFQITVRVDVPDQEWLVLGAPVPLDQTPPTPDGWPLRLVVWDAVYCPEPRCEALPLPAVGASPIATIVLTTRGHTEPLAARITLLHDNAVLQTGVLRVAAPGASGSRPGPQAVFTVDAAPQPVLDWLDGNRWFDAALVLNHDAAGTARATFIQDDSVAVVPLGEASLKLFTETVERHLTGIADSPERYDGLRSEGTEALLRDLAIDGAALYETLHRHGVRRVEPFLANGPLQVVSALVDAYLPVEHLYRWPAPDDDAKLCSGAEEALEKGICPAGCSGQTDRVCPLGFWGLSRVLERHAYRAPDQLMQFPFQLRADLLASRGDPIAPLVGALVGASDLASAYDPAAVSALVARLSELLSPAAVRRADDWTRWVTEAGGQRPSVLVLLPHHEVRDRRDYLLIGADSDLMAQRIRAEHVGPPGGPGAPIVLLMGCRTQFTRVQFDSFVTRFRDAGARIVVATVATVLGRHAAPAAAELLATLKFQTEKGPARLGEAMLTVRRTLLARGIPMALGLTAYGDADCVLQAASHAT